MFAEIITIGDEILIGQIVDSNSAWIAQQLNLIGIKVIQISSISDNKDHIHRAMDEARSRADLIIMTGGLGPTKDDITKNALCEYFGVKLVFNEKAYEDVKYYFGSIGKKVTDVNRKQAEVPENCVIFRNKYGTAPGMWCSVPGKNGDNKVFISLPGIPLEMKVIMENEILQKIQDHFGPDQTEPIVHRTVLIQGIGETSLSEIIAGWENSLEEENIHLAYLPSPGLLKLRLSIKMDMTLQKPDVPTQNPVSLSKKQLTDIIKKKISELNEIIPQYIIGYDDDTLEKIIGKLLNDNKYTLSTAESCTGGYIAHRITSVPGSSAYYKGSVVSYSDEIKISSLGVSEESLAKYGAVSEQVVREMAEGVQKRFKTDFAIACTGIAGPDGGTDEKPVGTVWIAVAAHGNIIVEKFLFGDNREKNILITAITALNMLRKEIISANSQ